MSFLSILTRIVTSNPIVYGIYERILASQVRSGRIPEHIGVILDGNRRWATQRALPRRAGHRFGADKVDDLVQWCLDLNVRTVTLYAFSTENFSRPQAEVQELMRVFEDKLKSLACDERIRKNQVHIRLIGRLHLLPESTQALARAVEEQTRGYDRHYLNIALAYGGRAEIVDAAKRIAEEAKAGTLSIDQIDEAAITNRLYTSHLPKPEPDLIIRTSGEERLSGFLLWQAAYSELCFIDVFWPDFRRIDLWRAIRLYQQRDVRRGK